VGTNQRFTPLELGLIDEGRFLAAANVALSRLQRELLAFKDEHKERAKGAKAQLTLKVRLACERPEDDLFTVRAAIVASTPDAPASSTVAMASETDAGEPALFVRRSGSTADTPRQAVMCTEDGREVVDER